MPTKSPRIAARAVIVHENRLLLVNAWPGGKSDLLCAPGGGAEPGASLPDNLKREVFEETGLHVSVGAPCLINEFHDPRVGFHQIEIFFRCTVTGDAQIASNWQDPEDIVDRHIWARQDQLGDLRVKPDSLAQAAFSEDGPAIYDALETIVM
ncbi:NUDIX domain-containing protein [uncultured Roseobacter sp.]|uniref:NUDIX domain-containing protein n=1 Tax=uncultured Roseobacter sp. TaxID=114847 RepID=UPI002619E430|nr:NUDIX domain-containing protein [uncultured Roseobacter sp.]